MRELIESVVTELRDSSDGFDEMSEKKLKSFAVAYEKKAKALDLKIMAGNVRASSAKSQMKKLYAKQIEIEKALSWFK